MEIETVLVGPFEVNCYIAYCPTTADAVVIDPGDEEQAIIAQIRQRHLVVKYILLTHGHIDHISAVTAVQEMTGAHVAMHRNDLFLVKNGTVQAGLFNLRKPRHFKVDRFLKDGDAIHFGEQHLRVLATPGHTPGGLSFFNGFHLFAGDTLFCDSIGRTDLPGSSHPQIVTSIQDKLYTLPDETIVHPGHGPSSTIGREKHQNPFVRREKDGLFAQ